MNVVFILGISGVGKTTLISKFLEKYEKKVEYLNFGTLMYEIAKNYGVKNRDELRKLDKHLYYKIFFEAIEEIEKITAIEDKELIIIDTHVLIDTKFGTFVGVPKYFIKKITPNGIVVISANPKEIIERAKKDKSRNREDLLNEEKIKIRLDLTRNLAFTIAYDTHALFKEIFNKEGELEKAYKELENFLKNFISH